LSIATGWAHTMHFFALSVMGFLRVVADAISLRF